MSEYIEFVSAALLLLFVPGPTNTLLATRGALLGFRGALDGMLAEMSGYALAILMLRFLLVPIAAHVPLVRTLVQVLCASYLFSVSYRLWTGAESGDLNSVSCRRIFVSTMTNPKAFLFAFVILPTPKTAILRINMVNGLTLLALIMVAGTLWTLIGALAAAGAPLHSARAISRIASILLVGFSVYILVSAVGSKVISYATTHVH